MDSKILEKNKFFLEKRFSKLYAQLKALISSASDEIFEKDIFATSFENHVVFPYGQINAENFIDNWIQFFTYKSNTIYVITGFGTGLHVERFLEQIPKDSTVVIAEPNLTWLNYLFSHKDCSSLLSDERILILTDLDSFDYLETIHLTYITNIKHCIFSPLFVLNESFHYQFFTKFCQEFDMRKRLQATCLIDSELLQKNVLKNLKILVNAPTINCLKNKYKQLPLVLVSAGPSLDSAIPFLQHVQDKAIIMGMNSSYRILQKQGIHSHFTLAIDPNPTTFSGFKNESIDSTVLLTSHMVYPEVVAYFSGQIMTWNFAQTEALVASISRKLQCEEGPYLEANGTVANLVGPLADFLGCKKVCLVGQDLAHTESGQTHASGSFYQDRGALFSSQKNYRRCPGNTLKSVLVDPVFFLYLQIFNRMAEKYPNIQFINTSPLGAAIKDIPYLTYEAAEKWIGENSSQNVTQELFHMLSKQQQITQKQLQEALKPLLLFTQQLSKLALQAGAFLDSYEVPTKEHERIVRESYSWADKINQWIDAHAKEYAILLSGKLLRTLSEYNQNLNALLPDYDLPVQQLWIKNREYFWVLFAGCNHLLTLLMEDFPELNECLP